MGSKEENNPNKGLRRASQTLKEVNLARKKNLNKINALSKFI
jgi:hypothetical protein